MKTRLDFVFVELLHDAISSRIELLEIILRPPHYQVSVRVELRARVVEAMRHFVTNDGADTAIVERVVRLRIVEGRLQNSRGKNDLVHRRIVISIHCRRRHSPLSLIDRLANLAQIASELE